MYGLSLFSGYAGIDIALRDYVRPIMYCEIERYAQGILLSRMDEALIDFAPIWNDVTTLDGSKLRGLVDIIYGGFPCQDLSVAGKGKGLAGERSGLFYEIIRLTKETGAPFVFLENVPAIRTRGLREVISAFREMGYDCRWTCVSASSVGANHKRERWFLLAHSNNLRGFNKQINEQEQQNKILPRVYGEERMDSRDCSRNTFAKSRVANTSSERLEGQREPIRVSQEESSINSNGTREISDSDMQGQCKQATSSTEEDDEGIRQDYWRSVSSTLDSDWWAVEPDVGRVANGVAARAHRIKALGNGVVPLQVKTAFEKLIGVNNGNQ